MPPFRNEDLSGRPASGPLAEPAEDAAVRRNLEELVADLRGCITTATNVAYLLRLDLERRGHASDEECRLLVLAIERLNRLGADAVCLAHDAHRGGGADRRTVRLVPTHGEGPG